MAAQSSSALDANCPAGDPPGPARAVGPVSPAIQMDANMACSIAQSEASRGNVEAAEAILRRTLSTTRHYRSLTLLAIVRELRGDLAEALALYARCEEECPGDAFPFTRRALIHYRSRLGNPPTPRPFEPNCAFVAMPSLGANGRFGNQLLQYGMLRLYADRFGLQPAVPDWIGRDLFGLDDPVAAPGATGTETLSEDAAIAALAGRPTPAPANVNLHGYFCGATSNWAHHRDAFRAYFTPAGPAQVAASGAETRLRQMGQTIVGVHIRHGDFGGDRFWIAPTEWYLRWLSDLWPHLHEPVLFLATDDPAVAAEFRAYRPVIATHLAHPLPGAEFFLDHWLLRQATYLAVSNSTFSYTAALLNPHTPRVFRPDRALSALRPCDPWAEKVLLD